MSERISQAIDERRPWPGLGAFDEGAERFFNGRSVESTELHRLIGQAPLTVLFGVSGLGKSSLLQAGVFPRLRKDNFLPVFIRLDVRDREAPLLEQAAAALAREVERQGVDVQSRGPGESLWQYLHRVDLEFWSAQNQLLTPVLVFDQFEEVITLGADNQARIDELRRDLADLIENRVPSALANAPDDHDYVYDRQRYRVVLSFREDFLPAIEEWKRAIPSMARNRLRLLPMSGEQAFSAIHDTAPELTSPEMARELVQFVQRVQGDDGTTGGERSVEPSLLSLLCHGLNERRIAAGKPAFDAQLLRDTGDRIIADFYAGAVGDQRRAVRRFIESELITERGFRKQCDVNDAKDVHGITAEEITTLIRRRLWRVQPGQGSDRLELTHDLLTGVVREHRDAERETDRRKRRWRAGLLGILISLAVVSAIVYKREQMEVARDKADKQAADSAARAKELATAKSHTTEMEVKQDSLQEALASSRRAKEQIDELNAKLKSEKGQLTEVLSAQRSADLARTALMKLGQRMREAEGHVAAARQRAAADFTPYGDSLWALRGARFDVDTAESEYRNKLDESIHSSTDHMLRESKVSFLPQEAAAPNDLFDVSQGVVTATPVWFGGRARTEGTRPGRDSLQLPTDSTELRWDLPRPVTLRSVAIFAQHDLPPDRMPTNTPPLGIARLRLERVTDIGERDSVAGFAPALPYAGVDPWADSLAGRSLGVCLPVEARGAMFAMTVRGLDATRPPRLLEVDGYEDADCGGGVDYADFTPARKVATARRAARSTRVLAAVLRLLDVSTESEWSKGGQAAAIYVLQQSDASAWTEALGRWALRVADALPEPHHSALVATVKRLSPRALRWRAMDAVIAAARDDAPAILPDPTIADSAVVRQLSALLPDSVLAAKDLPLHHDVRLLRARRDSVQGMVAAMAVIRSSQASIETRLTGVTRYFDLALVRGYAETDDLAAVRRAGTALVATALKEARTLAADTLSPPADRLRRLTTIAQAWVQVANGSGKEMAALVEGVRAQVQGTQALASAKSVLAEARRIIGSATEVVDLQETWVNEALRVLTLANWPDSADFGWLRSQQVGLRNRFQFAVPPVWCTDAPGCPKGRAVTNFGSPFYLVLTRSDSSANDQRVITARVMQNGRLIDEAVARWYPFAPGRTRTLKLKLPARGPADLLLFDGRKRLVFKQFKGM